MKLRERVEKMSQGPSMFFFGKFFFFWYGLDTFWEQKKRPIFFPGERACKIGVYVMGKVSILDLI